MKRIKISLVALLLLTAFQFNAQTIHWLTFVDTTDGNVGKIDVYGREMLYSRFVGLVNTALQEKGYKTDIHDVYGARLSPETCKREVANLSVGPNDVVVFYYIGHGGRSINDKTQWPQMCLGQNYDNKFIPLEWVHNTIKGKNPRLTVTIGMCCNSYVRGLSAKSAPAFTPNYGNIYMSQSQIDTLAKLFADYKGDIILSSSTPGQTSGCLWLNDKVIDAFTACLVVTTEDMMNGEVAAEWSSFFGKIKDLVGYYTKEVHGSEQTVQFVSNVTAARTAQEPAQQRQQDKQQQARQQSQKPAPQPKSEQEQDSSSDIDKAVNYYNELFNLLVNTDLGDDNRIELAEKFTQSNSNILNLNVVTIGQDGNTVVGRQSLEDFVGRLATSRIMRSVAVAGISDRGIEVREVYRK